MSLYARYATNKKAETEGVTLTFPDGIKFTIRSTESDRVREVESRWMKRNRQTIMASGGIMPPAMQDDKDITLLVDGIIVGWEGVTGPDGQLLEFTRENAKKLVTDLRELRKELLYLAGLGETFRAEALREAVGNSPAPSAPISE